MSTDKYSDEFIFEINDFSTSTPWESFIANIEEVLLEWKNVPIIHNENCVVSLKEGNRCVHWMSEDVTFGDDLLHFTFAYYNLYTATPPPNNAIDHQFWLDSFSFESDVTNIFKWFCLSEYAVLKPKSIGSEVARNESALNFILSSASVALNNTGSDLAVFVQGNQPNGPLYFGHRLKSGFLTVHDTIHLRQIPTTYRHLSGLSDVFIGKLMPYIEDMSTLITHFGLTFAQNCNDTPDIHVSIRFTYFLLNNLNTLVQRISLVDGKDHKLSKDSDSYQLPFGIAENSISSLGLFASWHNMPYQNIVDNDVYSDLEHFNAHECHLVVNRAPPIDGNLQITVQSFHSLSEVKTPMSDLLDRYLIRPPSEEADLADAFSPLTGQSSAMNILSFKTALTAPLNGVSLAPMMSYIFPDGWRGDAWYQNEVPPMEYLNCQETSQKGQMKSCPEDSLLSRLARVMALVNKRYSHGNDYSCLANVWHEFNTEIQARWRAPVTRSIVGLQRGSPNMSYCLLYQKFQMLNCCVEITRSRSKAAWKTSSATTTMSTDDQSAGTSDEGDEDEFYECEEVSKDAAEGRLRSYNDLRLLSGNTVVKDTSRPRLYVPITQNAGPLTEDMLEEQADLLSRLGTTSEGAHLRARMQSAGLLSDMESFKAANPSCQLADFVRWYSPRDWSADPATSQGTLSGRMLIDGNLWQSLWKSARQTPVSRQKRLFDDTKEAEKILHWLSSLNLGQVCKLLMPVLLQETLITLNNKIENTSSNKLKDIVSTMSCHAEQLTRENLGSYQIFCSNLGEVERLLEYNLQLTAQLKSDGLECSMCQSNLVLRDLSTRLLESPFAKIEKCRKCSTFVGSMFSDKKQLWHREYVLRCEAHLPSALSRPSQQRLYASITPKEQLVVGSFSEDTTFK